MTHHTNDQPTHTASRRTVLLALSGAMAGLAAASALQTTRGAQSTPEASPGAGSSLEDVTPQIVAAANAFMDTLSDDEKATGLFDWSDTAQKQRWSNFPDGAFERAGLMWGDLGDESRNAWLALMQVTLSPEGYERVFNIWHADDYLGEEDDSAGGGPAPAGSPSPNGGTPQSGGPSGDRPQVNFGSPYYYMALIGEPSETEPWQWQFGGHHLVVNATLMGDNLALTPAYLGTEPLVYTNEAGETIRPLGDIEDDAFALVNLLDASQQQTAVLGDTPIDVVLGPGQDGRTLPPEGLPGAQMTPEQQDAFLTLIAHYAGLGNAAHTAARMAEIESGLDDTYLAWYGPTTQGDPAYFRVTGPTVIIEYSPQANRAGQAPGDDYHVHGVYRDPTNDYGAAFTGVVISS